MCDLNDLISVNDLCAQIQVSGQFFIYFIDNYQADLAFFSDKN